MKIYDRLKGSFINKSYYISFSNNYIYIMNYKRVNKFNENIINVDFDAFSVILNGTDFKIKRKNNIEIEITGNIRNVEFSNEI